MKYRKVNLPAPHIIPEGTPIRVTEYTYTGVCGEYLRPGACDCLHIVRVPDKDVPGQFVELALTKREFEVLRQGV